ncbi:hypothetical protein [Endozoicomonas sp. GU-1]|uniref:hypothetical protein n=1 Tax=Endozoicomonas sp. GU-1 TaxID=3009078 RepID=UPI0022B37861|nr:hypothetical protein [Endozoicomonas sp. GU-1]WBA79741.1 hypothetical protein O2T12_15365 [Endozoicomonas sp. GU-1]WBA87326.1 hypothetical protein O3276_04635 [Endozoicomonas sp. GU-1]
MYLLYKEFLEGYNNPRAKVPYHYRNPPDYWAVCKAMEENYWARNECFILADSREL